MFWPCRRFFLWSTLCPIDVFYFTTFVPVDIFYLRPFVFFTVFFIQRFVPFVVFFLRLFVRRRFLPSAFFTPTFCRWIPKPPQGNTVSVYIFKGNIWRWGIYGGGDRIVGKGWRQKDTINAKGANIASKECIWIKYWPITGEGKILFWRWRGTTEHIIGKNDKL